MKQIDRAETNFNKRYGIAFGKSVGSRKGHQGEIVCVARHSSQELLLREQMELYRDDQDTRGGA